MKDPIDRTKVVVRQLPPSISQSALMEKIDDRFAGRYKWVCFRSGKNSQKNQRHSRAYIDFKSPEDVVEFAEFFDGHVFVNEKGGQFKTLVEYAPSQRVPKAWSKKDGREGTILKDPEYLEFLDLIAKPVENLPSAEIQLERREAERAGGAKESLIVTPLMDFVRQKRAAKSGSQRSSTNGKPSRRSGRVSPGNASSPSSKRGSEKRRVSTSVYVLRDSTKSTSGKDKSTYILVPRRGEHQLSDKSIAVAATTGGEMLEDETVPGTEGALSGGSGGLGAEKRRLLLLKGKEKEISHASSGVSHQQIVTSPMKNSAGSTAFKQNQRREAGGRMIKSILSNKETRQSQSPMVAVLSEQQLLTLNSEKEKRPPRPTNMRLVLKDHISSGTTGACISDSDAKRIVDDKIIGKELQDFVSVSEKQDKRTRNKDRPDRGVWTPLRRSDGSHASDESLSSSSSLSAQLPSDSLEGMSISQQVALGSGKLLDDAMEYLDGSNNLSFTSGKPRNLDTGIHNFRFGRGSNSLSAYEHLSSHREMKVNMSGGSRCGELKTLGSGRSSLSSIENGSHKHVSRRGPAHGLKDVDGSLNPSDVRPLRRGGAAGYVSHEKQVWVQKSGSGS